MKKFVFLLLIFIIAFPMQAFAYSYGDPTKEDIAETFKLVKSSLDSGDWSGAHEAYKVRRAEISSHFGASIATTLDQNFKAQQKDAVISNYRHVLYLNLDRRFDYAKKDINDYSKAKLLVAKAKGTFDVLRPYVQSKLPGKVAQLDASFENALKALGNPGLFGVGQEPVQPEVFTKETAAILSTLKPIFPYSPAKAQEAPPAEQKKEPATPEPKQPVKEEPKKETVTAPKQETKQTAPKTETKTNTSISQAEQTNGSEKKQEGQAAAPPVETESASTVSASAEEVTEEESKMPADTEEAVEAVSENSLEEPIEESVEEEVTEEALAHDPMERSDKTNPLITVIVIGSVIILGLGGLLFAKKKGFI